MKVQFSLSDLKRRKKKLAVELFYSRKRLFAPDNQRIICDGNQLTNDTAKLEELSQFWN